MQPIKAVPFRNTSNFLSEKLFENHKKLYEGYVDKTNEISQILQTNGDRKDANATYSQYRGLKKGETYAINGVILHELYFQNIGKTLEHPAKETQKCLQTYFGDTKAYIDDLLACGKSARGWVVLLWEQRTRTLRNVLLDLHDYGVITTGYPILVLDMYEHAYAADYGTDKVTYINNFVKDINWNVVEERLQKTVG